MTVINTLSYTPPPAPAKREETAKSAPRNESSAASSTQTDSYDKTTAKDYVASPKGAVRYGESWVWPPDALTRTDTSGAGSKLLSKTEVEFSANAAVNSNSGESELDAKFKGVLMREAVEYSGLEKRIHNLLGFTLESFRTTMKASGEVSAKSALADGTFFESAFSGYAASYSLFNKITYDSSFRSRYGENPPSAVEYGFESLRTMMESIVLRQGDDGNVTASFE